MRIALNRLDTSGLNIDIPHAGKDGATSHVVLTRTEGLRGQWTSLAGEWSLAGLRCERALLSTLTLFLGTVVLRQTGEAELTALRGEVTQHAGVLKLDLQADVLLAERLALDIHAIALSGKAHLHGVHLALNGADGSLRAAHLRLADFVFEMPGLRVESPELSAKGFMVGWGHAGFHLEAESLAAARVSLSRSGLALSGEGLSAEGLHVHAGEVHCARASLSAGNVKVELPEPRAEAAADVQAAEEAGAVKTRRPIFDYRLLDGLSGRLHVDMNVDMTIPVFGSRRAVHKFRVAVDDGTLDYRELEADLSALEESLLDFAVRDGALVLERGIPLLPTRGRGKPLVIWPLDAADLSLAERRRVRLSVLPRAQLAPDLARNDAPASGPKRSSFALRRLGLDNMDVEFHLDALPETLPSSISRLRVERLAIEGQIAHELTGGSHPGHVDADIQGLEAALEQLGLGALALNAEQVQLARLAALRVSFEGLRPRSFEGKLTQLSLSRIQLVPHAS